MILYAARRWLNYEPPEWDALPWHYREMYLEGLSAEEDIPFRMDRGHGQGARPGVRQVDAAVAVIDLDAMRQELEANPAARRRT